MSGHNESGKRLRSIVRAALIVAVMIGGCDGRVQDETGIGSETNWLGNCETTGACLQGTCLCGVCTTTCSNAADCGETPAALCATPDGLVYQATCGEASAVSGGVCVQACESDGDCEDAMICVVGACVNAPNSATDGEPQSIEAPLGRNVYSQFVDRITQTSVAGDSVLTGRCIARSLPVDAEGAAPCLVAEAFESDACACTTPGRRPASHEAARLMLDQLEAGDVCAGADCARYCICEMEQETGAELDACRNEIDTSGLADGWCYVDPAAGLGNPSLVLSCSSTERRLVRFAAPLTGQAHYVIACEALTPLTVGSRPVAPGPIGASCLPGDELRVDFSGFGETEASVELGSPECDSGVCLVNAFRGRASCPYGQPADPNDPTRPDPSYEPACLTPAMDSAGSAPVTVAVTAQLTVRRPEEAVYCSCRCNGPEGAGPYCACPTGFECAPLVKELGLKSGDSFAGFYCVKAGTHIPNTSTVSGGLTCSIDSLNCGPPTGGF
jgi:hypothetical protein